MVVMNEEMDQSNVAVMFDEGGEELLNNEAQVIAQFTLLLEEIDKIDDLEALEEIENVLLLETQNKEQQLNMTDLQNQQLREELNLKKCFIRELGQQHKEELEKITNLRETIQLRQLEVLQEQDQRGYDLDQFEANVAEVSEQFASAPKQFDANCLNGQINLNWNILEEEKCEFQQQIELQNKAQTEFEEPIEIISMDLPLKMYNSAINQMIPEIQNLTMTIKEMEKTIESLKFDKMTQRIQKM